jgi:hypothetical protein
MLSVAVIFFTYATGAFVIGVYLLGIRAEESDDGGKGLLYSIGWVELLVGLFLAVQTIILVETAGLPTLAGIVGLFALFFTALGIALVKGADLRPVGTIAFVIGMFAWLYVFFDGFNDTFFFQSNAIVWSVAFLAIAAFTYGMLEAKALGAILVVTAIWGWLPALYLAVDASIP